MWAMELSKAETRVSNRSLHIRQVAAQRHGAARRARRRRRALSACRGAFANTRARYFIQESFFFFFGPLHNECESHVCVCVSLTTLKCFIFVKWVKSKALSRRARRRSALGSCVLHDTGLCLFSTQVCVECCWETPPPFRRLPARARDHRRRGTARPCVLYIERRTFFPQP